jgi:hypothetical protein
VSFANLSYKRDTEKYRGAEFRRIDFLLAATGLVREIDKLWHKSKVRWKR